LNETLLVFVAETTDGCFLVVRVVGEVKPGLVEKEKVLTRVVVGVNFTAFCRDSRAAQPPTNIEIGLEIQHL
jgi:hypothetical protein